MPVKDGLMLSLSKHETAEVQHLPDLLVRQAHHEVLLWRVSTGGSYAGMRHRQQSLSRHPRTGASPIRCAMSFRKMRICAAGSALTRRLFI